MKRLLFILAIALFVGCPQPRGADLRSGVDIDPSKLDLDAFYNEQPSGTTLDPDQGELLVFETVHGKKITSTWQGKVVSITHGDSITVLNSDNEQIKVRLESIDTPERKQPFGEKAKDVLAALIHEKTVNVRETGKDRDGRTLAFIDVTIEGELADVNSGLVYAGLAWNYKAYSKSEDLAEAEQTARTAKIGLWSCESD